MAAPAFREAERACVVPIAPAADVFFTVVEFLQFIKREGDLWESWKNVQEFLKQIEGAIKTKRTLKKVLDVSDVDMSVVTKLPIEWRDILYLLLHRAFQVKEEELKKKKRPKRKRRSRRGKSGRN